MKSADEFVVEINPRTFRWLQLQQTQSQYTSMKIIIRRFVYVFFFLVFAMMTVGMVLTPTFMVSVLFTNITAFWTLLFLFTAFSLPVTPLACLFGTWTGMFAKIMWTGEEF